MIKNHAWESGKKGQSKIWSKIMLENRVKRVNPKYYQKSLLRMTWKWSIQKMIKNHAWESGKNGQSKIWSKIMLENRVKMVNPKYYQKSVSRMKWKESIQKMIKNQRWESSKNGQSKIWSKFQCWGWYQKMDHLLILKPNIEKQCQVTRKKCGVH